MTRTPTERLIANRDAAIRAGIEYVIKCIAEGGDVARTVRDTAVTLGCTPEWLTARVHGHRKSPALRKGVTAGLQAAGLLPIKAAA